MVSHHRGADVSKLDLFNQLLFVAFGVRDRSSQVAGRDHSAADSESDLRKR
jgi:hypothetical protein